MLQHQLTWCRIQEPWHCEQRMTLTRFCCAILQLTVAASKATLMNMMVVAWACTAVVPLAFVGFDLEVSWSMQHQVRTDALGYVAHCHRGCWSKQHRVMYMSY
jgi:hypothetical protein